MIDKINIEYRCIPYNDDSQEIGRKVDFPGGIPAVIIGYNAERDWFLVRVVGSPEIYVASRFYLNNMGGARNGLVTARYK